MPTEKKKKQIHAPHKKNEKESISKSQFSGKCNYPPRRPASAPAHSLAFGKGKKRPNEKHEYTGTLVTYVVCMQREIYIYCKQGGNMFHLIDVV